jgi:hypothetical protein
MPQPLYGGGIIQNIYMKFEVDMLRNKLATMQMSLVNLVVMA